MAGPLRGYTYGYRGCSALGPHSAGTQLTGATSGSHTSRPYVYYGRVRHPRLAADLFLALMAVVRARYHLPATMLAKVNATTDPVVTCNGDCLRFEAFSGCA